MWLVLVTLVRDDRTPVAELSAAETADVMWAFATPAALLEHVSVLCAPSAIHLGFYSRLEATAAVAECAKICRRALASSPALRGWELAQLRSPPRYTDPDPDM